METIILIHEYLYARIIFYILNCIVFSINIFIVFLKLPTICENKTALILTQLIFVKTLKINQVNEHLKCLNQKSINDIRIVT